MDNKANEATPQRPEGARLLNSEMVEIDLPKFMRQLKSEPTWADSDHNSITVFKSEVKSVVLMGMKAGAELKTHTAKGEITLQILEGEITFTTEAKSITMKAGNMVALEAMIPHSVHAVAESFILLTVINLSV